MNRKTIISGLLLLMVIGCANWEKTSAVSYRSIGVGLEQTGRIAKNLMADGTITIEDGLRLQSQYKLARESYILAGDILKDSIEVGSLANAKDYDNLIQSVNRILNNMNIILDKYLKGDE